MVGEGTLVLVRATHASSYDVRRPTLVGPLFTLVVE